MIDNQTAAQSLNCCLVRNSVIITDEEFRLPIRDSILDLLIKIQAQKSRPHMSHISQNVQYLYATPIERHVRLFYQLCLEIISEKGIVSLVMTKCISLE